MAITRQLTFVGTGINGAVSETFDILPGTLQILDADDVRGGTDGIPAVKVGVGGNGKCDVLLDTSDPTLTTLMGIISPVGAGDFTVTDATNSIDLSKLALVDISPKGDSVQIFEIRWKGTNY